MNWTEVASEVEWDRVWRDIYIVDATVEDWQRVLDAFLTHENVKSAVILAITPEASRQP